MKNEEFPCGIMVRIAGLPYIPFASTIPVRLPIIEAKFGDIRKDCSDCNATLFTKAGCSILSRIGRVPQSYT